MKVELKNKELCVWDDDGRYIVEKHKGEYPMKVAIYFDDEPPRRYFWDNTCSWHNAVGFEIIRGKK